MAKLYLVRTIISKDGDNYQTISGKYSIKQSAQNKLLKLLQKSLTNQNDCWNSPDYIKNINYHKGCFFFEKVGPSNMDNYKVQIEEYTINPQTHEKLKQ